MIVDDDDSELCIECDWTWLKFQKYALQCGDKNVRKNYSNERERTTEFTCPNNSDFHYYYYF